MGSQQPHSGGPKGKAEQSPGGHIPDIVRPGKHPQGADEQGHHHHAGPGGGVKVAPHSGQHGGAQGVAGGEGLAVGLLGHQRREAGLLIRAGKVQPGPQERAAQKDEGRHKDCPGDELHKIQSGGAVCREQPEPPDIQQHQQQRVAGKGHGRQPAVQGDHQLFQGGAGLQPAQQGLVAFRGHGIPPSKTGVQIVFNIKRLGCGIFAQVERVMGMAFFAPLAKGDPRDVPLSCQGHHLPHQAGQVVPLFDQGAPCGPHGGLGLSQNGPQPAQVLVAEGAVRHPVHVVGVGGALGIYVEHDPAVKAVGVGQPLHTL